MQLHVITMAPIELSNTPYLDIFNNIKTLCKKINMSAEVLLQQQSHEVQSFKHNVPLIQVSCVFTQFTVNNSSALHRRGIPFHINEHQLLQIYILQSKKQYTRPISAHVLLIKTQLGREQRIRFSRGKKERGR